MIEHLKGRERALASLGWTGREAEWIALVCLHSGAFTRAQFCHYFEAHRSAARRIVRTLLERREAVESEWPVVNGGGKSCRISSKPIYRALGIENIGTGGKLPFPFSGGGFSRLILSWNIRV